jgi:hypothetical protein
LIPQGSLSLGNSINQDTLPRFRTIQGDSDAVDESGDEDAEAAGDDETALAVKHSNSVGNLERLQTELPNTVLALLPQYESETLKLKKQKQMPKLKEKNQDQDLKQDKKMKQENEMNNWNQENKKNMNQRQNVKQDSGHRTQ